MCFLSLTLTLHLTLDYTWPPCWSNSSHWLPPPLLAHSVFTGLLNCTGSSDIVSLLSSTSPLRQHWASMAQSEFTDLLTLHWLPQHSLVVWTIQAFTGPFWQYLPSLAFPDSTGLCWPIHNFDPLRGLRLSLAHSNLDNVDLCWPTPTPLIHSDNTGLHCPLGPH